MIAITLSTLLCFAVFVVEYAIPVFESHSKLRSNNTEEIRDCLQYWVCVFAVNVFLFFVEPIYSHFIGNMDLVKLPFFVWFSNPTLKGYKKLYDVLFTKCLIRYTNVIHDYIQMGVKWVTDKLPKEWRKQE